MCTSDLDFAAGLHLRCLNHGLFPALGKNFLRAYLNTFVASPFGLALLAENAGKPVGFLVGTSDDGAHYRYVVRRHGAMLALRGLIALLRRPAVAWRFAKTRAFRYVRGTIRLATATSGPPSSGKDAVLAHMVVVPQARGYGVGSALAQFFVRQMDSGRVSGVRLTTRSNSAGASGFYEKLGWHPQTRFVDQDGLEWLRLRLELDRP